MKEFDPAIMGSSGAEAEINHYIGQLKQELGKNFTEKMESQFRNGTKALKKDWRKAGTKESKNLFSFANRFLSLQKKHGAEAKVLGEHFEDRVIAKEKDFNRKAEKEPESASGYIATKKIDTDGLPFMMKDVKKSDPYDDRNDTFDAMNFVNEYITAPLYKRTLYDRTPVIELVEGADPAQLYFRSKFLHDFQTVSEFTGGGTGPNAIGAQFSKLKQVEGAEKIFASMLAWGEYDIHAGNIGVMKIKDDVGGERWVLAKIDHGWSATQFFTDPSAILENFATAYKIYGYQDTLPLDAGKLKEAIDQITFISVEEIETFVKSGVGKLKANGFNLENLEFQFWKDDKMHSFKKSPPPKPYKKFDSFDDLEKHYIDHYKQQMATMREVSKRLDTILKIDKPSDLSEKEIWENGKWLYEIRGLDPIAWAANNGKKIEGLVK